MKCKQLVSQPVFVNCGLGPSKGQGTLEGYRHLRISEIMICRVVFVTVIHQNAKEEEWRLHAMKNSLCSFLLPMEKQISNHCQRYRRCATQMYRQPRLNQINLQSLWSSCPLFTLQFNCFCLELEKSEILSQTALLLFFYCLSSQQTYVKP